MAKLNSTPEEKLIAVTGKQTFVPESASTSGSIKVVELDVWAKAVEPQSRPKTRYKYRMGKELKR